MCGNDFGCEDEVVRVVVVVRRVVVVVRRVVVVVVCASGLALDIPEVANRNSRACWTGPHGPPPPNVPEWLATYATSARMVSVVGSPGG